MKNKKLLLIILALFSLPAFGEIISIDLDNSGWAVEIDSTVSDIGDIEALYVYGTTEDSIFIEIDKLFYDPLPSLKKYKWNWKIFSDHTVCCYSVQKLFFHHKAQHMPASQAFF